MATRFLKICSVDSRQVAAPQQPGMVPWMHPRSFQRGQEKAAGTNLSLQPVDVCSSLGGRSGEGLHVAYQITCPQLSQQWCHLHHMHHSKKSVSRYTSAPAPHSDVQHPTQKWCPWIAGHSLTGMASTLPHIASHIASHTHSNSVL